MASVSTSPWASPIEEQQTISAEAAKLGYTSIWTPEGISEDSFQLCAMRWAATTGRRPRWRDHRHRRVACSGAHAFRFRDQRRHPEQDDGGKFILGIGSGGAYTADYRRQWGVKEASSMQLMRDYVTTVRALVRGETVTYQAKDFSYNGVNLAIQPPPMTPIYLAALGPEMLSWRAKRRTAFPSTGARPTWSPGAARW